MSEKLSIRLGAKEFIAFGAPYMVAVGACYLIGYWGAFQINVFEYISFSDVVKLAIYPLMASLIFFLAGVVSSELLFSSHLPPGGGSKTGVSKLGFKHWRLVFAALILVIVLVVICAPEPGKWFLVATFLSLFSTPLSHVSEVIELLPNPRIRATVLFLSLLLPAMSFAYGRQEAYFVKTGSANYFVNVERSQLPLEFDEKSRVAYLGLLGDLYVLREGKTGNIVFLKQRSDTPLFLMPMQSDNATAFHAPKLW
jgi:hypothetical protein